MRERAKLRLLYFVTLPGSRQPGPALRERSREEQGAGWVRAFEDAAWALTGVGLLTESDVAPLRRRLGEEIDRWVSGSVPPRDEKLAGRARELLEARLAELPAPSFMTEFAAHGGGRTPRMEAVYRFELLLRACHVCGAVAYDEGGEWRSRLVELDDGATPWLERERRRRRFDQRELRAVVRGDAAAGTAIVFAVAELYGAGTVVRWHQSGKQGEPQIAAGRRPPERAVTLADDLGTDYLRWYADSGEPGSSGSWTARFATAVPAEARRLVARIDDEQITFPLAPKDGG